MDKSNTTTQISYLIQKNIFTPPEKVVDNVIETEWFRTLNDEDKAVMFNQALSEWWKLYGNKYLDDIYTETIYTDKVRGDITSSWIYWLEDEIDYLEKYIGIKDYKENIKNVKTSLLDEYIKELSLDINKKDKELVKKELEKRRHQKGGCSIWKKIGIPYLYKHHPSSLTSDEIKWYKEQKKRGLIDE